MTEHQKKRQFCPMSGFAICIGRDCALWHEEDKRCGLKSRTEALCIIANMLRKWQGVIK